MEPLYTAIACASAGREGRVTTDDGGFDVALAVPKGLGGHGGPGTNPEQLFAAGYAACFGGAMRLVAARKKITGAIKTSAKVTIGKDDDGNFKLAVEMTGKVAGHTLDEVRELMEEAHQVCPYSRATRGNIDVTLTPAS